MSEMEPLSTEYSKETFISIVTELSRETSLPLHKQASQIYQDLKDSNGVVVGQHIHNLFEYLKSQQEQLAHQSVLAKQLQYLREFIGECKCSQIRSITNWQCRQMLDNFIQQEDGQGETDSTGGLCAQIEQRLDGVEYISVNKLEKLVNKIDSRHSHSKPRHLTQYSSLEHSQIFTDENNQKEQYPPQGSSAKQQISQANQQQLLTVHKHLNDLTNYTQHRIADQLERESLLQTLQRIRREIADLQNSSKCLQSEKEQMHEQIRLYESCIRQKEEAIIQLENSYENKVQKLETESSEKTGRITQLLLLVSELQAENAEISRSKDVLMLRNRELEPEVEYIRSNYQEIADLYAQLVKKTEEKQQEQLRTRQKELFGSRTIKQQLEDARNKIVRLRGERMLLQQTLTNKETQYQLQISALENQLKEKDELIRNLKPNNQFSKISEFRYQRSKFVNDSEFSEAVDINVQQQGSQQIVSDSVRKSVMCLKSGLTKNGFSKKKTYLSTEFNQWIQQLQSEENVRDSELNDELDVITNEQLKEEIINKVNPDADNFLQNKKHVSSYLGSLIHDSGQTFPIGIMVTQGQIIILDSKCRIKYIIEYSSIKCINFCYHNIDWFTIHFHDSQLTDKLFISELVISIRNRSEFIRFVSQDEKVSKVILEKKVRLQFEKEDNIWMKVRGKEILLSHFAGYYNLYRITLSQARNCFEATFKQEGLFQFSIDAFLLITSAGILAFERDSYSVIEKSMNKIYVIPLVEKMKIIVQQEKQYCLKLQYETERKVCRIKFRSRAVSIKFKRAIERQIANSVRDRQSEAQEFESGTSRSAFRKK